MSLVALRGTIGELNTQVKQKQQRVEEIWNSVDARGENAEPDKKEVDEVISLNKEIEDLEKQIAEKQSVLELRSKSDERSAALNNRRIILPGQEERELNAKARAEAIKALSDYFYDNPEVKAYLDQISPLNSDGITRRPPSNDLHVTTPRAAVPITAKALVTGLSDTSAGAIIGTDYQRPPLEFPMRPLEIRDVITIGSTDSDLVEYPRVTSVTNNAAPTAEATNTSTGTKPESAIALEKVTTAVKTIAHWIPVTKRALADAGQIRTMIDNFLRYGLAEELEDQIVSGNGSGENFTGILNTSGITAQAYDTNILTTARKARTKSFTTGRAKPNAYLLHPLDWEAFDLTQDNEARYFFGGPSVIGNPRLWGLPVIESEALPQGTGLTGDFKQCVLWDRQQATVTMTDSHSDFFVKNLVAILAELRAAFGILRPAALVTIDLTP